MIKDNINIYKNFDQINSKCFSCGHIGHEIYNCKFIHYESNKKEKILKSYFFPNYQIERKNFYRKNKKFKRIIQNNKEEKLSETEKSFSINGTLSEEERFSKILTPLKLKKTITNTLSNIKNYSKKSPIRHSLTTNENKLKLTMIKLEKEIQNLKFCDLKISEDEIFQSSSLKNFQEYFPHNNLTNIVDLYNENIEKEIILSHSSFFYTLNFKKRLDILNFKKKKQFLIKRKSEHDSITIFKRNFHKQFSLFSESKNKISLLPFK